MAFYGMYFFLWSLIVTIFNLIFFQAALLYTSAKGERRIRVHTLCLPTSASVSDIINSADQQAVLGMLVKFGKY